MPHKISIIIPALNEENSIAQLLQHLIDNSSKENIKEIIVVDGGSQDATKIKVSQFKGVKLFDSQKGRAKQMNYGAKYAKGDILYFLHADSFPPKNFDTFIITEVKKGNQAGCFKMKFDSNHWWLVIIGWFSRFSWKVSRGGDQSQFITQTLFKEIGGFNEDFTIYEDYDLINKLYARKAFVVIPKWLITSARMYSKHGVLKTQYHYLIIHLKKWRGASLEDIHKYYRKKIA